MGTLGVRKGFLIMAGKDQYMNFFTVNVQSAANSATLVVGNFNTGSGMATNLAWRIHKVELFTENTWDGAAGGAEMLWALSTRKAALALPGLTDKGTITAFRRNITVVSASGAFSSRAPQTADYLPPMIIASPNLSIYCQTVNNFNGGQNHNQEMRIGFTTEKLSEGLYREVFETWNYAN